jgi:molybdopterin synthase sulfur carrier subunit
VTASTIDVNVRYFAAARAAAGMEAETVSVAVVLDRCSFLCDGIAVRDVRRPLQTNQTVDVLPPFAGG